MIVIMRMKDEIDETEIDEDEEEEYEDEEDKEEWHYFYLRRTPLH